MSCSDPCEPWTDKPGARPPAGLRACWPAALPSRPLLLPAPDPRGGCPGGGPALAVPLRLGGLVFGALFLFPAAGTAPFDDADQAAVAPLAELAAHILSLRGRLAGKRAVLDGVAAFGPGPTDGGSGSWSG